MDEIKPILLLLTSGLLLRFSLTMTGQAWAKSHSQTVAFLILPVITYVITKTISGALSIVRFRHPVKSALELIMYFDLITIGIATSVRTKWAIQLVVCTIIVIFLVKFLQKFSNKFGRSFYNMSFSEGNISNSLEVSSKEKIDFIENSEFLINSFSDPNAKNYTYRLSFNDKDSLQEFKNKLNDNKSIEKINVVFN